MRVTGGGPRPRREPPRPPPHRNGSVLDSEPYRPSNSASSRGLRPPPMERLWSLAVATGGNRWQMGTPRKRPKQAATVATGCDQLPIGAHGKEGVDGSSPSEGSRKSLLIIPFC